MGWKTFKERYNIAHIVTVYDGAIHIGSPYCANLAAVDMKTGELSEHKTFRNFLKEQGYQGLISSTCAERLDAINAQDVFERSIPVYYFDGTKVRETFCEELGWPNVTHDGLLMYDDALFTDSLQTAIENARERLKDRIEQFNGFKADHKKEIHQLNERIATAKNNLILLG